MEQYNAKKLKLYKQENEGGEKGVGRASSKKGKEKKIIKLEKSTTKSDPSESVIFDPSECELRKEQKGHLATKEEVKLLRTKLTCLNSDVSELETQLEDKEDKLVRVKEERDDKINMMKLYIAKKCRDMEDLKAVVASSNPGQTIKINRNRNSSNNVAVQTDLLLLNSVVTKEEGECDESPEKEVSIPLKHEKRGKNGNVSANKIKVVEDISSLVEEVLKENTNLLHINDALDTKMMEMINIQKVTEDEKDKLIDDLRELQTKVLRLTIDNMRLKKENHMGRGMQSPLVEVNQE